MGVTTMKRHPNSRFCIVPMITCYLPLFILSALVSEAKCSEARGNQQCFGSLLDPYLVRGKELEKLLFGSVFKLYAAYILLK